MMIIRMLLMILRWKWSISIVGCIALVDAVVMHLIRLLLLLLLLHYHGRIWSLLLSSYHVLQGPWSTISNLVETTSVAKILVLLRMSAPVGTVINETVCTDSVSQTRGLVAAFTGTGRWGSRQGRSSTRSRKEVLRGWESAASTSSWTARSTYGSRCCSWRQSITRCRTKTTHHHGWKRRCWRSYHRRAIFRWRQVRIIASARVAICVKKRGLGNALLLMTNNNVIITAAVLFNLIHKGDAHVRCQVTASLNLLIRIQKKFQLHLKSISSSSSWKYFNVSKVQQGGLKRIKSLLFKFVQDNDNYDDCRQL